MSAEIIIILLLTIISIFSIVVNVRLFNIIVKYEERIKDIKIKFEYAKNRINNLDLSGAFKSDDEVGWTFDIIHDTIVSLNQILNGTKQVENKNGQKEEKEEQ